jgi:O-acetylserine/cysteine efflux transporter
VSTRDLLSALLIVFIWGVNFVAIKAGVAEVTPMLLGALRFVVVLFPAALFVRPPKVPLKLYVAAGMTLSVGQFAFLFSAIRAGMPVGLASVVVQSQAFFTLFFAAIWLKEGWAASNVAGLALAGGGLAVIGLSHGSGMPLAGFLLSLAAAASWAAGNIVTRAVGRYQANMFAFVVWSGVVPPIPFLLLSWVFDGPAALAALAHVHWPHLLAAVAYLGWVSTLVGYGLWSRLLSRYPANRVAPFTLLVPFVGIASGVLVYGERLQVAHAVGVFLVIAGLVVNVFGARLRASCVAWMRRGNRGGSKSRSPWGRLGASRSGALIGRRGAGVRPHKSLYM